jgi:hypothetical protein
VQEKLLVVSLSTAKLPNGKARAPDRKYPEVLGSNFLGVSPRPLLCGTLEQRCSSGAATMINLLTGPAGNSYI